MDARKKYLEIHRKALLGRLQGLSSKLEDPNLTPEKLKRIREEVEACQQKLRELGFTRSA